MDIINRIKENFNKGYFDKSMTIPELPEAYPAWTIKQKRNIGVAVPLEVYIDFSERFANAQISTHKGVLINGIPYDLLILSCTDMELRNEFAVVCSQFVQPGVNGVFRKELISAPQKWWDQWKSLLGNFVSNREPYATLGELEIMEKLLCEGEQPYWSGVKHATHDLELDRCSFEVKSTIKRYGYEVTINSIYQMDFSEKPLYLVFLRFEKSEHGRSVDEVAKSLIQAGYPEDVLEKELCSSGLERGCTARSQKYRIIEAKEYCVNNEFPAVTMQSFKGNNLPHSIVRFTYTVDLAGVDCRTITMNS